MMALTFNSFSQTSEHDTTEIKKPEALTFLLEPENSTIDYKILEEKLPALVDVLDMSIIRKCCWDSDFDETDFTSGIYAMTEYISKHEEESVYLILVLPNKIITKKRTTYFLKISTLNITGNQEETSFLKFKLKNSVSMNKLTSKLANRIIDNFKNMEQPKTINSLSK